MHSAALLILRHSLNAMATSFLVQLAAITTRDVDRKKTLPLPAVRSLRNDGLSTVSVRHFQVGDSQFGYEQTSIRTTFSGTYFENAVFSVSHWSTSFCKFRTPPEKFRVWSTGDCRRCQ